jgi:hypothetical protein
MAQQPGETELPRTKLKSVTTDGAPCVIGRKHVSWAELGDILTNKIHNFTCKFSASSTNSYFMEKLQSLNIL